MAPYVYNNIHPEEDESHQKISSYFLGPKAENYEFFKNNILEILEGQRDARLDYFPRDGSPRYQGHMCMDLSMPSLLGYFMTMIYNPNNGSIEASSFTTVAEMSVGDELCRMFGYNNDANNKDLPLAWGHKVCGGTIANLESVWVARNLKFYPLSIRSAMKKGGPLAFVADLFKIESCTGEPKLVKDMTSWEMLNLKPKAILDIPERLYRECHISPGFLDSVMKKHGIQSTGKTALEEEFGVGHMRYFVSNTRHYSWPRSAAVTGIGSDHMIGIHVDHGARVDLNDLRAKLQECLDKKIAVYAVVAFVGSTEEGAVDPLRGILALRKGFQSKGLSFLVHGDGGWGGYFCTMLPRDHAPGAEVTLPSEKGSGAGFVPDASLRSVTQEDLFMLREVDSITVDPHKAAYIPYQAGALCYRDGRMHYHVTWTSPYISRSETTATSIGVFGIKGSKPGASVMSTWFSDACIGLGREGYGKLLSEVTFTCSRLSAEWAAMSTKKDSFVVVPLNELSSELASDSTPETVEAEKQKIRDRVLHKSNEEIVSEDESRPQDDKALALLQALGSDLNINAFSTNWRYADGTLNTEVEDANYFNQRVIQRLSVDSPEDDPTKIPFYLTSTTFILHEYGECAQPFKKRLGLLQDHEDLVVMRNVEFKKVLEEEVQVCRERNSTASTRHEFLLQGTDKIYAIHFPMFHLQKHRQQLIIEVELTVDAKKNYVEYRKAHPAAAIILKTLNDSALDPLVDSKDAFEACIEVVEPRQTNPTLTALVPSTRIQPKSIIKSRPLRARDRLPAYPPSTVPFFIYGTPSSLCLDHILVRSPNIQLSADNIELILDDGKRLDATDLSKSAILYIEGISEASMQPFAGNFTTGITSTDGGGNGVEDSNFFFGAGKSFNVSVYEDPGKASEPLDDAVADPDKEGSQMKLPRKGKMTLGEGRYVDSVRLNKDLYEVKEGDEKFKAWREVFEKIGKELE